ncbi:MAG: ABC transporter permease [Clostridiales bacterium]|jgi:simple sugar transport system permease protein|nr:ABC transporter permease [Clostridiales bacterium]
MREIAGYIFSVDFANAILRMSTPLLFVSMAAVVGAKADVLCIAYEGMMLTAALGGVIASAYSQSLFIGLLGGLASGMLIAVIFAYFMLVLDTKPMLVGLALNMLGSGGTIYATFILTGSKGNTNSLPSLTFPSLQIPLVRDIPVLGQILSGHNVLTYLSFLSVIAVYVFIYKTPLGMRIRAVGENPDAARSAGVNVVRTKFTALMISGLLASFGGIFMTMGYLNAFTRDMISGRGFIGIAAQNLGQGHPLATMICTMVFGGATAAGNMSQSLRLPSQIAQMAPYVVTLLGLALVGMTDRIKKRTTRKKNEEKKKSKEE